MNRFWYTFSQAPELRALGEESSNSLQVALAPVLTELNAAYQTYINRIFDITLVRDQLEALWDQLVQWGESLVSTGDFAESTSGEKVQKMYIAYYGRPADPEGLAYWSEQLDINNGNLTAIIDAFGTSAEFTERFGNSAVDELVNNIYRFLFGRSADSAGLDYYVTEFRAGRFSLPTIALNILDGGQNADARIVANKLATAKYFTTKVKTDGVSYGANLTDKARIILERIDATDASVASGQLMADSMIAGT